MSITYRIDGLDKLLRNTNPKLLMGPLRKFFTKSGITVQTAAKRATPVDTGRLRNSLTYRVDSAPLPLWCKIGTNVEYGKPVEFGTGILSDAPDSSKSRYFPPPAALDTWARRHGLPNGFVAARAIYLKGGTAPKRFLRGGLESSIDAIVGHLNTAAKEVERDWV